MRADVPSRPAARGRPRTRGSATSGGGSLRRGGGRNRREPSRTRATRAEGRQVDAVPAGRGGPTTMDSVDRSMPTGVGEHVGVCHLVGDAIHGGTRRAALNDASAHMRLLPGGGRRSRSPRSGARARRPSPHRWGGRSWSRLCITGLRRVSVMSAFTWSTYRIPRCPTRICAFHK